MIAKSNPTIRPSYRVQPSALAITPKSGTNIKFMMTPRLAFNDKTTGLEVARKWPEKVQGRTFLITGVSPNGIGATTAISLASEKPEYLILAGRNRSKTQVVIDEIENLYPGATTTIFINLDLASLQSVREAAKEIMNDGRVKKIDVLVNNAGVLHIPTRDITVDGFEMHFACNHLGHFLFTNLLMPKLIESARGGSDTRIINISSRGHLFSPVRFSDLTFTKPQDELPASEKASVEQLVRWRQSTNESYNPRVAYAQSKTANILHAVELRRRLQSHGINAFAVHPGAVGTEIWRHEANLLEKTKGLAESAGIHWKNPDQGCSTTLVAALSPDLTTISSSGSSIYLEDCQIAQVKADWAVDPVAAGKLWQISEELTGYQFEPEYGCYLS